VTVVAGGEGEPARKDQGARENLAGGDVQVGIDVNPLGFVPDLSMRDVE
jgi:hypothetical protein